MTTSEILTSPRRGQSPLPGGREAVPHGDVGSEEGVLAGVGPARCLALDDHHGRLDKNVSSLVYCRRKPPQAC